MPGYDRQGPLGTGPMTGFGRGQCGRFQQGQASRVGGRYPSGGGRECRRRAMTGQQGRSGTSWTAAETAADDQITIEALKARTAVLTAELKSVQSKMAAMTQNHAAVNAEGADD